METFLKIQRDGKIHYIGFSAHSEEAAHASLDHFDFDSILFPLSFTAWILEEIAEKSDPLFPVARMIQ